MKISWTPTAKHTYLNTLSYLEEAWTQKEIVSFINKVDKALNQIVEI